MKCFRGRKQELNALQKKFDSEGFQMIILYGRRRIGKTELVNEFMRTKTCKCISFTAVEQSEKELLALMTETVLDAVAPEMTGKIQFPSFEKLFEFIGDYAKDNRLIFFIDEYPYLAKQCPYIQSVLQKTIDKMWKQTQLYFVICGSLVAFMKDEVLAESAPLHGRCTYELKLKPFDYLDTATFLEGYSSENKAIVYGLTNGVAKYIEQFDVKKTLYENIVDQFFSTDGYFSDEQIKTVISNERKSPALFNSVISAIATGHTKNNEIAGFIGSDDITYPLKVLTKSEIIEKRVSGKPYYKLTDSMLVFWFKYVCKATSLINAGKGDKYFYALVKDKLHEFMGEVFEKICREYLFRHAGEEPFPLITDIENYQKTISLNNKETKQIEIDLLGRRGKDILLIGECKFQNEKVDKQTFDAFRDKVNYLEASNPLVCMFSLSGYSDYVRENAGNIILLSIDDLYQN